MEKGRLTHAADHYFNRWLLNKRKGRPCQDDILINVGAGVLIEFERMEPIFKYALILEWLNEVGFKWDLVECRIEGGELLEAQAKIIEEANILFNSDRTYQTNYTETNRHLRF